MVSARPQTPFASLPLIHRVVAHMVNKKGDQIVHSAHSRHPRARTLAELGV